MKDLKELTQKELVETSGGCWFCIAVIAAGIGYITGKVMDWF